MKLTPKRQRFVDLYPAVSFNGTEAARQAGYANPRREAARLLSNADIQAALAESLAPLLEKTEVDAERVTKELACVGFSRITDFVTWDADGRLTINPSSAMTEKQRAAIRKVKVTETVHTSKNGEVGTVNLS